MIVFLVMYAVYSNLKVQTEIATNAAFQYVRDSIGDPQSMKRDDLLRLYNDRYLDAAKRISSATWSFTLVSGISSIFIGGMCKSKLNLKVFA